MEGGRGDDTSSQKKGFNKERDEGISKTAKAGYDYNRNSINYKRNYDKLSSIHLSSDADKNQHQASHLMLPDLNSNDTPFEDTTEYRSLLMSIFYVGKKSRFELLFPSSYLATFSSKPMQSDYDKAIIISQYLYRTQHFKINQTCHNDSFIHAYIDASYVIHRDAKSHTGSLIFDNSNILDGSST